MIQFTTNLADLALYPDPKTAWDAGLRPEVVTTETLKPAEQRQLQWLVLSAHYHQAALRTRGYATVTFA